MSAHANHADALRRILVDELDAVSFESSELARCEACARVVAEHRQILGDLEALAADERASLRDARHAVATPGRAEAALRAHVFATLPARASATPSAPARDAVRVPDAAARPTAARRRPIAAFLAVAALLVLALFAARLVTGDEDDDRTLGPESRLLHPNGAVESYAPFRWDVELPEGGHFVVHVEGEGLDVTSPWLRTQEWSPEGTSAWPAQIVWRLHVYRASGPRDAVVTYVARAQR